MGKLNWGSRAYALLLLCAATAIPSPAQTFTSLFSFDYGTRGNYPSNGGLVQATNGELYGTTYQGGAKGGGGYGTIFQITPSGRLTTVHRFDGADGAFPLAGLIQATDGNLYGTTTQVGISRGTVFKITPRGTLTTIYRFCKSDCRDGYSPSVGLVQGTDGNFYGTTTQGGANFDGTIFQITPSGRLTTLYTFDSLGSVASGLIQATNGYFYGTTDFGGANSQGSVFKMSPSGTLTTLYSFCPQRPCTDGNAPGAGLVQASDGNFYGTTEGGGTNDYGTVFKITPRGTLTTLYSFCSQNNCPDGASPSAALVQATDGNLYGTTSGIYGVGTIFKITLGGKLTTLYTFCSQKNCNDGTYPSAALIQDTNGTFYGTTDDGGTNNLGTIFSLSVSLGPFVELQETSGKVGAAVNILGTDLTGATSVTFHGTAAVFKVVSASFIKTTVPQGATTGTVEVKTPHGTLNSNVVFQVRE